MIARWLLTIGLIVVIGGNASAQSKPRLAINVGVRDANLDLLCSSRQAQPFYDALNDAEYLLDSLPGLLADERYTMLSRRLEDWEDDYFDAPVGKDCMPSSTNFRALGLLISHRTVEHFVGNVPDIEPERILPLMQEMAALDVPLINAGFFRADELVLNQPFIEMPACTVAQARSYYATIDGYAEQFDRLDWVYDRASLTRWYREYQAWVAEHWSPFYQQPCGWVNILMYVSETDAYGEAFFRMWGSGDQAPVPGRGLQAMKVFRGADGRTLRLADDDAPAEAPQAPQAPWVPVDRVIQAVVDAYLNRE